ncbi:hypothetical protein LGN19_30815 [Burkholderia sp. AU30198]|uniref:hypothetical protein n=1 Tax=Burkholderia sp. AU30198 TaxID=2879627 RepID=UPI001CF46E78|nr:hypothetical protein [Burkholderia sp. AU30198]MCA8298191.1 hypothetical protein [Burkholderia sp. AU30198]
MNDAVGGEAGDAGHSHARGRGEWRYYREAPVLRFGRKWSGNYFMRIDSIRRGDGRRVRFDEENEY